MITVHIVAFPGERRQFSVNPGTTVADVASLAGINLRGKSIQVSARAATASTVVSDGAFIVVEDAPLKGNA